MERIFRVPEKREYEPWDELRKLWEAGFRFWSYRSLLRPNHILTVPRT